MRTALSYHMLQETAVVTASVVGILGFPVHNQLKDTTLVVILLLVYTVHAHIVACRNSASFIVHTQRLSKCTLQFLVHVHVQACNHSLTMADIYPIIMIHSNHPV